MDVLYIATNDRFQQWALASKREIDLGGIAVWIAPPEYVIVGKLEFFREGGSEKYLRDIRGILAITEVDRALIEQEVDRRGLREIWEKCRE